MISSIDPAPSVISCGGQSALFLSACPQGFQKIFQQGAKGPEKITALLRQPATPPARSGTPRDPLSALPSPPASLCLRMALRNAGHPASPQGLPSSHRPSDKSFWKGGARGGRTFFQKGFPLRKLFSLQISRRLPAVPKTKNPRRSGDKKRPHRAVSCKGVSNNLWQRPTFPHDVMQYHRRWRA